MESKAEVRRRIRGCRAELSTEETARRGELLAQLLASEIPADSVVAGYLPMPGEPNVLAFQRMHIRRGGEVYAPVVADQASRSLQWVHWADETTLRPGVLPALMEPAGARLTPSELIQHAAADRLVFLVPALAVDAHGSRLGQGGGFYDTMMARHPEISHRARLIAVVHPEEVLITGSFPVKEHDLRVSRVATHTEIRNIGPIDPVRTSAEPSTPG